MNYAGTTDTWDELTGDPNNQVTPSFYAYTTVRRDEFTGDPNHLVTQFFTRYNKLINYIFNMQINIIKGSEGRPGKNSLVTHPHEILK